MNKIKNKHTWKWRIGVFVFVTLVASIFYSLVKVIVTPETPINTDISYHNKSDYLLMLLQCILGLTVFGLPSLLEKKFSFEISNRMCIAYFIFLYCAIYLGEVRNFYYVIPCWDDILHCFSGAMLGAMGFSLVKILNDSNKVNFVLSPIFICLFAFCFAMTAGAIWEIYEYLGDTIFGLNMQKYRLLDGTVLVGNEALKDTMTDFIVDGIGALIVVICGYISMQGKYYYRKIKKKIKSAE